MAQGARRPPSGSGRPRLWRQPPAPTLRATAAGARAYGDSRRR